jgi:uncharacterized membrane protein YecN with MAPEG domain
VGTAQQHHLNRAARNAGEAFAFDEPEATRSAPRSIGMNALWLAMAAVAVVALWLSF